MKIVTWNCNSKFSKKFPAILEEDADIYVIQECDNPLIANSDEYLEFASNYFWVGENQDLVKYYRNGSQFTFKLLNDKGKPVAGQKASININGVFYTRTTNDKGIATFQINLEPGTYILTMEYKGCRVSNRVTVLSILQAKNLNMKYRDGSKFEVKLLDGQGKPFAGQKITFNINGVFYDRNTDVNGVARLNINLMAGQYIITSMYSNGAATSNKVTISS